MSLSVLLITLSLIFFKFECGSSLCLRFAFCISHRLKKESKLLVSSLGMLCPCPGLSNVQLLNPWGLHHRHHPDTAPCYTAHKCTSLLPAAPCGCDFSPSPYLSSPPSLSLGYREKAAARVGSLETARENSSQVRAWGCRWTVHRSQSLPVG